MTKNYYVEGMTCEHCVAAVTEELENVAGAQGVEVDLASGRVTVTGEDFS
ncbi:heavy-metal-associated domain-containing protein, partial [Bacteroides thetaiotaomicron]|nr:heavy-metal-associated domain-containing protein [Bacteroides thetaiotaomicron]